jgi:large subunit ribosomal protein L24
MKFGSMLSQELKAKHHRKSVRPCVGDSVRIVRGEYKDIEGKVTHVDPSKGVVNVEGVNREKLKGGTAPVDIASSKLMITTLALDDKVRKAKLEVPE